MTDSDTVSAGEIGAKKQPESNHESGLLSVPPEIRHMIYDYLPHTNSFHLKPGQSLAVKDLMFGFRPPELARVHPILRAELLPRLYSHLYLELTETYQTTSFTRWLGTRDRETLSCIKIIAIEFASNGYPYRHGTIHIELTAQPSVTVEWIRTYPECKLDGSQSAIDRRHRRAARLDETKTAVERVMRSHMPKHPEYERRLFTHSAWKSIKNELWKRLVV